MKTLLLALLLLPIGAFGQTQSSPVSKVQSEATQSPLPDNPREWVYGMKSFARSIGNVGGWWSFLSENEKSAFLDAYQISMTQAHSQESNLCKVLMDRTKNDPQTSINHMITVIGICDAAKDFDGFDKVTVKDLDEFYSDPINQPMLLAWTLPYLRDRASGRKTAGQLLDALQAEQKDVHDCTKYPGLCKLGTGSK